MDPTAFWRIVDSTLGAPDQEEALAARLRALPACETVALQQLLRLRGWDHRQVVASTSAAP
jgi:hypothetical protein